VSIPMSSPDITEAEIQAVQQVLRTNYLSIGPQINAFEQAMARYVGLPNAIGVNSGTSGLHLCCIATTARDGDLVITTPFSFIASANSILYERAVPVAMVIWSLQRHSRSSLQPTVSCTNGLFQSSLMLIRSPGISIRNLWPRL